MDGNVELLEAQLLIMSYMSVCLSHSPPSWQEALWQTMRESRIVEPLLLLCRQCYRPVTFSSPKRGCIKYVVSRVLKVCSPSSKITFSYRTPDRQTDRKTEKTSVFLVGCNGYGLLRSTAVVHSHLTSTVSSERAVTAFTICFVAFVGLLTNLFCILPYLR
jgi:hypothetical protein